MKTPQSPNSSSPRKNLDEQPVRLIKAAQASKLLGGGHNHADVATPHKSPEIRMIHAGLEYCDLEIICGCGESTQVRCWNAATAQEQVAA
jgi:hypothetical protein